MAFIARGKEGAFRQLYRRYAEKMYRYFYRMLYHHAGDAEDFTQELFTKIIEHPQAFDTHRKFSTWLFALAGNMVKNEYRRRERLSRNLARQSSSQLHSPDCLIEHLDLPVVRKYLTRAIQSLDEPHKQCFLLRFEAHLSIKEISEVLNCPEGTVKSRLHYTIQKLAQQLKGIKQ